MAGLTSAFPAAGIAAAQQFRAVAYLRWCLFRNGFRRKGGTGELVARIIVFPIAAMFVIGPSVGAGIGSFYATQQDSLAVLAGIFWGIFVLQIIVSINISQPGLSFDPESLIRFPLSFPRYLVIRLFLGLLSASTIVGTTALLSAALGISLANHALAPVAFLVALALALCNMLFVRMIFAWVDRWLSTRRAREVFTGLIFVFSIGIQYANVTFNNIGHHSSRAAQRAKIAAFLRAYHHAEPLLHRLPPGLAGSALLHANAGQLPAALVRILAILLFGLLFLAVFAWRMQREYRGENLSEAGKASAAQPAPSRPLAPHVPAAHAPLAAITAEPSRVTSGLSPVVAASLEKEFIYIRRNPTQLYGLLAPLAMVFLFAGRMGSFARTGLVFPAAIAYSMLGMAALAYNVLGLDASGVQFYFIAPVSIRSVILGKNLFGFIMMAAQAALVYVLLVFTSGAPPLLIAISTVCWLVFASLVNATIGNMRSITAPKKIDPSKLSRKNASQLSALMCIGIMLVIAGLGAGLIFLSRFIGLDWMPIPILLAFAVAAFALYWAGLNRVDAMAQNHRESLVEELSKASS